MINKLRDLQAQINRVILHVDEVLDAIAKEETSHRWLNAKLGLTTQLLLEIKAELIAAKTLIIQGGE